MKGIIRYAIVVAALLAGMVSCKKGDNEKLENENTPVAGFMSARQGSWWLYASNENTVVRRVATGRDSVKMGLSYNYYEATDTTSQYVTPEYFARNGDKFLMLVDLDGSQTNYMNVVVHKDNPQLGDTWSNTGSISYSGMSFDLLAEGEITGVQGTLTINGHTYTDVVEITNTLKAKPQIPPTPVYVNCGTARMWFQKGIGLIKSEFDISIASFYSRHYTDSLLDYHIEP